MEDDVSQSFAHTNKKKKVIDICSFWVGKLEFKGHRGFYKGTQVITIYLFSPFYKSIL